VRKGTYFEGSEKRQDRSTDREKEGRKGTKVIAVDQKGPRRLPPENVENKQKRDKAEKEIGGRGANRKRRGERYTPSCRAKTGGERSATEPGPGWGRKKRIRDYLPESGEKKICCNGTRSTTRDPGTIEKSAVRARKRR